jgi:hypothetical protein
MSWELILTDIPIKQLTKPKLLLKTANREEIKKLKNRLVELI